MYNISKNDFHRILQDKFRAIVGEQCKKIELIQNNSEISINAKFNLLKSLIKETNYESMRDIELQIRCFSDGLNYFKVNMNKSTS